MLRLRSRLFFATILTVMLSACSQNEYDPWQYVAANIPADANIVAAINVEQIKIVDTNKHTTNPLNLGKLSEYINLDDAPGIIDESVAHVLYVYADDHHFLTWPFVNNALIDDEISKWGKISIGKEDIEAHAFATKTSTFITTEHQVWLFPDTELDEAHTALSQILDDMPRIDGAITKAGLCPNPTAMAVITETPSIARAYLPLDDKNCTLDIRRENKPSPRLVLTLLRHDSSGQATQLSDQIMMPDASLRTPPDGTNLYALASLKRGTLSKYTSELIAPYLTIAQRVALAAVTSYLNDAEGTIAVTINNINTAYAKASIGFTNKTAAENVAGKLRSLIGEHASMSIETQGKQLILSTQLQLSGKYNEILLSSPRLILEPDKATLTLNTTESPLGFVSDIISILD